MLQTLFTGALLSALGTSVMLYVSLATPIGPWIGPTLVLLALLWYRLTPRVEPKLDLVYSTVAGSIGGIVATAIGFTFATLYFLDPVLFAQWMARPLFLASFVGILSLLGGWYGLWIARVVEPLVCNGMQQTLPFPISQMLSTMIDAYKQTRDALLLAMGFVGTTLFCVAQDGIRIASWYVAGIVPKTIMLVPSFSYSVWSVPFIGFDLWPMLWSIGFITGMQIVLPLVVGAVSKVLFVLPLHATWFVHVRAQDAVLAFCSGIVVAGALSGLLALAQKGWSAKQSSRASLRDAAWTPAHFYEGVLLLVALLLFFSYVGLPCALQCYLLLLSFVCAYQIIFIAGKIGLAQLGRFATFVLVPALFLFSLNAVQITVISVFVELVCGVAVDALFGRKLMQLQQADERKGVVHQYVGLIISCMVVGVLFWLLVDRLGLGSAALFAQRAQARALLVHVQQFNYYLVAFGMLFGLLVKQMRLSPMLVLGGLLMPYNIMLGLVAGGLMTLVVDDEQRWFPFWSGVFAANSLWMLVRVLF